MRRIGVLLAALALPSLAFAAEEGTESEGKLKTFPAKLSYTLGSQIGENMKGVFKDIDLEIFMQGLKDGLEGNTSLLTSEQKAEIMQEFGQRRQAEMKALGEKNLKEGEALLAENKKKKDVVETKSGLQYTVLEKGKGPKPKPTEWVKVYYRGTLIDGTEFDKTLRPDDPAKFPVRGVIRGWSEALQLMNVGSKCRLVIPGNLAYGPRGRGPKIGPNATLIFEVELVGIEEPPAPAKGMRMPPNHP